MQRYCRNSVRKSHGTGEKFHTASFHDPGTAAPSFRAAIRATMPIRSQRLRRVSHQISEPATTTSARIRMMMSDRTTLTPTPSHRYTPIRTVRTAMPPALSHPFCRGMKPGIRTNIAKKAPQTVIVTRALTTGRCNTASSVHSPVLPSATAKKASSRPRLRIETTIRRGGSPRSSLRPSESGKAAPIEKRKKGKTRSTHVIPATDASKTNDGGGSCAWNSHAGRSGFQAM